MNATQRIWAEDEYETELWDGTPFYTAYDYWQDWAMGLNEDYLTLAVSSTYNGEQGVAFLIMNYIENEVFY